MPEVRLDGLIILKQHERNISEKALYPLIRYMCKLPFYTTYEIITAPSNTKVIHVKIYSYDTV